MIFGRRQPNLVSSRAEPRTQNPEPEPRTGDWKLEAGSWKLETGSWQLVADSRQLTRCAIMSATISAPFVAGRSVGAGALIAASSAARQRPAPSVSWSRYAHRRYLGISRTR